MEARHMELAITTLCTEYSVNYDYQLLPSSPNDNCPPRLHGSPSLLRAAPQRPLDHLQCDRKQPTSQTAYFPPELPQLITKTGNLWSP